MNQQQPSGWFELYTKYSTIVWLFFLLDLFQRAVRMGMDEGRSTSSGRGDRGRVHSKSSPNNVGYSFVIPIPMFGEGFHQSHKDGIAWEYNEGTHYPIEEVDGEEEAAEEGEEE